MSWSGDRWPSWSCRGLKFDYLGSKLLDPSLLPSNGGKLLFSDPGCMLEFLPVLLFLDPLGSLLPFDIRLALREFFELFLIDILPEEAAKPFTGLVTILPRCLSLLYCIFHSWRSLWCFIYSLICWSLFSSLWISNLRSAFNFISFSLYFFS
jgi:hypothetical protein